MQTDVKSTHLNASGYIFQGRTRLKAFTMYGGNAVGMVKFRDGGLTGAILCEVDVPSAGQTSSLYILVPGEGVVFQTDIYAEFTGATASITAFYG